MSFLSGLLHTFEHVGTGIYDVATGNIPGAINQGAALLGGGSNHSSTAPPRTVQGPNSVYGPPGGQVSLPVQLNPAAFSGISNISQFSGASQAQLGTGGSLHKPLVQTAKGFYNFLLNQGVTGISETIIQDMLEKPFSGWNSHFQALWNSYQNSIGGSTMPTGTGSVPSAGMTDPLAALGGQALVMQPSTTTRLKAPKGYVIVESPYNGQKYAVRKDVALHLRDPLTGKPLYHRRKKPPISVREWEAAKAASRVEKKIKKLAGDMDLKTERKGVRRAPSRSKKPTEPIVVKETIRK